MYIPTTYGTCEKLPLRQEHPLRASELHFLTCPLCDPLFCLQLTNQRSPRTARIGSKHPLEPLVRCFWPPSKCSSTTSPRSHSNRQVLLGLLPTDSTNALPGSRLVGRHGVRLWGLPPTPAISCALTSCGRQLWKLLLTRPTSSHYCEGRTLSAHDTQPTCGTAIVVHPLRCMKDVLLFFCNTGCTGEKIKSKKSKREHTKGTHECHASQYHIVH